MVHRKACLQVQVSVRSTMIISPVRASCHEHILGRTPACHVYVAVVAFQQDEGGHIQLRRWGRGRSWRGGRLDWRSSLTSQDRPRSDSLTVVVSIGNFATDKDLFVLVTNQFILISLPN